MTTIELAKKEPEIYRIILVDDDEDEHILISDLLRECRDVKYQLIWKSSFKEGKEAILSQNFDACLIDFRLGEKSGIELLDEALREGASIPMILLTGQGDYEIDKEAMALGAADYLQKSDLTSSLLERVLRYSIYRQQMHEQAIAQDRMVSVGLLASSIAHEIGNPLGVIRGRTEILKKAADNPSTHPQFDIVLEQIDRISKLIRSLLDLARGGEDEMPMATPLTKSVKDVITLLDYEFRRHDIPLENQVQMDCDYVIWGNNEKLHQILLNLCINSIHAIETARTEGRMQDHFIRFSIEESERKILFHVSDSGCGIRGEHMKQLFRPFFTTKPMGTGTGLGLATSRWILQSWGGSIRVNSVFGVGSQVTLELTKSVG